MLKNKTVILGVTGSIAAYKAAALASQLMKLHCHGSVSGCTESKDLGRKVQYLTKGMLSYLFSEL